MPTESSAARSLGNPEARREIGVNERGSSKAKFSHLSLDVERAVRSGWAHKLDVCGRRERFGVHKAVLDSSAGYTVAYKACAWTQQLARKAGVEFILHPASGKVVDISTTTGDRSIIRTADGMIHEGDLVVVAGNEFPYLKRRP